MRRLIGPPRRVVITGMGAITPVGKTVDDTWKSMRQGECGIAEVTAFDSTDCPVKVAAEVKDYNLRDYFSPMQAMKMDRFSQFGLIASLEAYQDSGLDTADFDRDRFFVVFGSGLAGNTVGPEHSRAERDGIRAVSSRTIPANLVNMAAANVAIKVNAHGACTPIVTACATGADCIGKAFQDIRDGYCEVALAGAADASIAPVFVGGFAAIRALSETADPLRASIPFDKERNGYVMGEGAGALVLEDLDHARRRGARIYAEVVAYGATCDAYSLTAPDPSLGQGVRAISEALAEAEIGAADVSYINAHGTSTKLNDVYETKLIKAVFETDNPNVAISSTKSMTGHLMGAAGAVEAIISAKALEDGFIPPTVGYRVPDEECDLNYTPNDGVAQRLDYVLSNSLGFGGHNAALILKRWE